MPLKHHHILILTLLAIVLNAGILLLPSILLGVPTRILSDRRLVVFVLLVSLWIVAESIAGAAQNRYHREVAIQWLPILMSATLLVLFMASLIEHALKEPQAFTAIAVLGSFAIVAGIGLRYWAIRALGAFFLDEVTIVEGQPLIQTGIYKYLRHPSESGNLCIVFGSALLLGSLVGLLISTFIVLPLALIRIYREDKLLMRHYSDDFANYKRDVPALFPKPTFRP